MDGLLPTTPRQPSKMGGMWLAILIGLAFMQPLAFSLWAMGGWLVVLLETIVAVVAYWDFGRSPRHGVLRAGLYGVIALVWLIFVITLPPVGPKVKALEAEAKQNLYAIRLALEQYAVKHDRYPDGIDELVTTGYLPGMPKDPFAPREVMRPEEIDGQPHPGCFHYQRTAKGYALSVFGGPTTRGMDVDGNGTHDYIILILDSDPES